MIGSGISSSLLLPSELKHHIAELCPQNTLASLARTHTAYRGEAEQALYHTLVIIPDNKKSSICMKTLARNPEKAAFVRSLTVESVHLVNTRSKERQQAMNCLLKALINMHSLSEFSLRVRINDVFRVPWIDDLQEILCGDHLRLQTLFCNEDLDVLQIIKSQPELQVLGIYTHHYQETILERLKEYHDSTQLPLPIIFTLERERFSTTIINVSICPALSSIDRSAAIPQVFAKIFDQDRDGLDTFAEVRGASQLSIYLLDSSDMPSIYALVKDMAESLPQISSLWLWFVRPFKVTSQEREKFYSFFPDLDDVTCFLWSEGSPACMRFY